MRDLFFGSSVYKGTPSVHGLIVLQRRAVKRAAILPEQGLSLWGWVGWSGSDGPQRETNRASSSLVGRMTEIGFHGAQ